MGVLLGLAFVLAQTLAPSASASPAVCTEPNREVGIVKAVSPDYPDAARQLNLGPMTVLIDVTIGADGKLAAAAIFQSSNNIDIDGAALRAARGSTYKPKLVNCVPASGTYVFRAEFRPADSSVPPAPQFVPPDGWAAQSTAPMTGERIFDQYANDGNVLLVTGEMNPLLKVDVLQSNLRESLARAGVKIKNETTIPICGGTRSGTKLTYDRPFKLTTMLVVEVDAVQNGILYRAVYISPDRVPPDDRVLASLSSLCFAK